MPYQDNSPDPLRIRQSKWLDAREVKEDETRPEQEKVEEADEAEEKGHVDAGFVADLLLHDDRVDAVHDGAEGGHCVAEGDFGGGFVRE